MGAINPMQRKARNSFLLGMLVMLLISGVIIALLFMVLSNKIKKEQEGHYYLYTFNSNPEFIAEFERILRIDDSVLKHMVIKK